ncbi:MAG: hypothetical protein ACFFHV_20010 [Promethearchaeota archaeon]
MERKDLYKLKLTISTILGLIVIGCFYIINVDAIVEGFSTTEGMIYVVLIEIFLIVCISSMTVYMFHEWFKQEMQYLSDLPFLFAAFFLFLVFGKILDLLFFLTFFTLGDLMTLLLMKARWLIGVLTVLPMLFLSIGMLLYYLSLKEKFDNLKNEEYRDKLRVVLLAIIIFMEIIAIILAPNIDAVLLLLPLFVVPSLIMIVWLFYFSWKNKALPKVNSKILTIGFFMILISQFIRPLIHNSFGNETIYVVTTEIFSICVFTVIFIGFYKKPKF